MGSNQCAVQEKIIEDDSDFDESYSLNKITETQLRKSNVKVSNLLRKSSVKKNRSENVGLDFYSLN